MVWNIIVPTVGSTRIFDLVLNILGKIAKEASIVLCALGIFILLLIYCDWYMDSALDGNEAYSCTDYFSLYEWNYSRAGDNAVIAKVFGKNDDGNHIFLHIRNNNTVEVYVGTYDEDYLTKGGYVITIDGKRFRTSFVRNGVLRVKRGPLAYKALTSTHSFTVSIFSKKNRLLGEYKFKVNKKLN